MGLIRLFMEAEENQKRKFTCNKKFPCESLGGHLRSHRIARATEQKLDRTQFQNASHELVKMSPLPLNNEASSSLSVAYVLRENPRKTQRFGDSGGERFCKECGKGFRSMKALCGHMACHSERVTMTSKFGSDDDFSGLDQKLKRKQVVRDSQSDTEASSGTPRRGKGMVMMTRYKNNLGFFNNSSSSVSDMEHEQDQEVARCLMMLSRDAALIGDQSSDDNSLFLDSTIKDMKIKNKNDVSEGSDSGKFRMPKWVNHKSGLDPFDAESGERASKQLMKQNKVGSSGPYSSASVGGSDHELCASVAHKSSKLGRFEGDSFSVPFPCKAKKRLGKKKIKGHECPICFRVFRSGQALGGHKRSQAYSTLTSQPPRTLRRHEAC